MKHTEPSIVRIEDDGDNDDESHSSEREDEVLIKPEISPSSMENSDSVMMIFFM